MSDLRRFWFEFEGHGLPAFCGVTAASRDEALQFVSDTYGTDGLPTVRREVEDVDVSQVLDELEGHIRPLNVGLPIKPGIWFPNLNATYRELR